MRTTRSAIYKLTVTADCGCAAAGEYRDATCKQPSAPVAFVPCVAHKDAPGLDLAANLMKQAVEKEAVDTRIAPPAAPAPMVLDEATAARRASRVPPAQPASEAADGATPAATSAATPARAVPGVATMPGRTPIKTQAKPGQARPGSGEPRVIGGTGGVRRVDPAAKVASQSGAKAASGGAAAAALDIDEVPEDRRVTNLIEKSGFLDEDGFVDEDGGDDGGDIDFD